MGWPELRYTVARLACGDAGLRGRRFDPPL